MFFLQTYWLKRGFYLIWSTFTDKSLVFWLLFHFGSLMSSPDSINSDVTWPNTHLKSWHAFAFGLHSFPLKSFSNSKNNRDRNMCNTNFTHTVCIIFSNWLCRWIIFIIFLLLHSLLRQLVFLILTILSFLRYSIFLRSLQQLYALSIRLWTF